MSSRWDVLILGGGFAGLAAANVLRQRGKRAIVLEARERLGGRAWTLDDALFPRELGAEFVHGPAPVTSRLCAERGLTLVDAPEDFKKRKGTTWGDAGDYWGRLASTFANIPRGVDQSFEDYARALAPRARKEALSFVESFHGADPARISALALRQSEDVFEEEGQARRILGGYGALYEKLAPPRCALRAVVEEVRWRRGEVLVTTREGARFEAKAAIVTLPLGVLQERSVRFVPDLGEKDGALTGLEMGHALRVPLEWKDASLLERLPHPGFLLDEESDDFMVWWTPQLASTITAWAGGPRAQRLRASEASHVAQRRLAKLLRVDLSRVERGTRAARAHDWTRDEFAKGAYSFARVKGNLFHRALARGISRTLFFAGEATISDGGNATVEGALRSGEERAKNIF